MTHCHHKISLGFTGQDFEPGVHICQIFSDDDERQGALLKFILSGIQGKEKVACFSDNATEEAIDEFLSNYGISYNEVKSNGAFTLAGTRDVYFENDRFDPERMLAMIKAFHAQSQENGFEAARVIGEMAPEVHSVEGGSRLMEYESRISMLLREYPVTAVCQYDSRVFDGATIMDVLKVHPLMVVRGSVVHNPFYLEPEEYLESLSVV